MAQQFANNQALAKGIQQAKAKASPLATGVAYSVDWAFRVALQGTGVVQVYGINASGVESLVKIITKTDPVISIEPFISEDSVKVKFIIPTGITVTFVGSL